MEQTGGNESDSFKSRSIGKRKPSRYCGLESGPMNEFGEPNMGNPSVRFDEGRERVGHWPLAFQSNRSCLLYETEKEYSIHYFFTC